VSGFSIWWLLRHEETIRARERARERRRMEPLLATTGVRWSTDFAGAVE